MAPADRDTDRDADSDTDRGRHVAYFEDANETGSSVGGPKTYARPKNRPNVGRIITDQGQPPGPRRSASSSHPSSFTESDSTRSSKASDKSRGRHREAHRELARLSDSRHQSHQYDSDREREHQRHRLERKSREYDQRPSHERSSKESTAAAKKSRPALEHAPPHHHMAADGPDDYPSYAYQQPAAPPSRPSTQSRSATYHAGQFMPPPPAPGIMWHPFPPGAAFPPGAFPPGAFPPPGSLGPPLGPPGPPMHYPPLHEMLPRGMPPPSPASTTIPGYFNGPPHPGYGDHLKSRFVSRPSSAMGAPTGPERLPPSYLPDDYGDESAPNVRRRQSRLSRGEEDRRKMPPPERIPQRAMSAAPQPNGPYRPPGRPQVRQNLQRSSSNRHSVNFGDEYEYEEYDAGQEAIQDIIPPGPYYRQKYYREPARPGRRSKMYADVDIFPAGQRSRPSSMYAAGGSVARDGIKYATQHGESKMREAQNYQDAVTGGPKMPLTKEMLRKATRGNPSSQSTRSSGSRDDSEYRRSYSTGLTRSSSRNGAEEVTITVGSAVLTVHGGAQVTVSSGNQARARSGSERASTVYQIEDGREQECEAPRLMIPDRTRAPSHSEQRPRGYLPGSYSPYEQPYAEGGYA